MSPPACVRVSPSIDSEGHPGPTFPRPTMARVMTPIAVRRIRQVMLACREVVHLLGGELMGVWVMPSGAIVFGGHRSSSPQRVRSMPSA